MPDDVLTPATTGAELEVAPAENAALLLSALERRYLGDFEPARWQVADTADSPARPVLRQVEELGGAHNPPPSLMANVLTALHTPGQATVMVAHGDGDRHTFHYGGRRMAAAGGSAADFLAGQAGALQANLPGLRLAPPVPLDAVALPTVTEFLQVAPALGVLTGVPSVRIGPRAFAQNIDRLTAAVAGRRYAVVVVAEPIAPADLDAALDRCRRLRGDLHGLARRTVTESEQSTTSESTTRREVPAGGALPAALASLQLFCSLAGTRNPASRALRWAAPLGQASSVTQQWAHLIDPGTVTSGTTVTSGRTVGAERLDAGAEAAELLIRQYIDRMEAARTTGWWRTAVYLAADSDAALAQVASALRSIYSGDAGAVEPVRLIRPAAWLIRDAMLQGTVLSLTTRKAGAGHPLGAMFDTLATCLTSDELAVVVAPPRRDVPGTPVRDVAEFAVNAPAPGPDTVPLGMLQDSQGNDLRAVGLSGTALNRHVFITGMTGFGKTTTAQHLLREAYQRLGVPFLVIEPAKAEYRALRHDLGLRVFTIGGDSPLRLNPFLPVAGASLARHIDLLKAVFNAAFPMFAGMSYVLEEAMLEIYTERGWNLRTSTNEALGAHPSPDDLAAVVPSLTDLHDKIDEVLTRRAYAPEVHQNMGAALRSRLRSLMVGTKGLTLNGSRSVPVAELFEKPCVIELRNLGDDEEKSFVMALLLCLLYEHAEARAATGRKLRHLTLIEEAHRLLSATRSGGAESPDVQAKAVTMFTDLLAEMRAYGEGFLIADQIPTKLAADTLKNTDVKILHRLAAPDDRAVLAAMTGLTEAQSRHLANLRPGVAVVHDSELGAPVLLRMPPPAPPVPAGPASRPEPSERTYLHLNGACRYCPEPCDLLDRTGRPDVELLPFFRSVLAGSAGGAWRAWSAWRRDQAAGVAYCAAAQAGYRWLATVFAARSPASAGPVPAAERVRHDQAARELARLCRDWSLRPVVGDSARAEADGSARPVVGDSARAETDDAAAEFATAQRRLRRLLAEAPPRELPGCRACPFRCHVLPLLADRLTTLAPAVAARATQATPAATRVLSLTSLAGAELDPALTADTPLPALLYCLVTNATADRPDAAADLLSTLAAS
jgi:hypothetical protein